MSVLFTAMPSPDCTGSSLCGVNFPDHWTSPLSGGWRPGPALHIAYSYVNFLRAGITFMGLDIFTVLFPFLVGVFVVIHVCQKLGVTIPGWNSDPDDIHRVLAARTTKGD